MWPSDAPYWNIVHSTQKTDYYISVSISYAITVTPICWVRPFIHLSQTLLMLEVDVKPVPAHGTMDFAILARIYFRYQISLICRHTQRTFRRSSLMSPMMAESSRMNGILRDLESHIALLQRLLLHICHQHIKKNMYMYILLLLDENL